MGEGKLEATRSKNFLPKYAQNHDAVVRRVQREAPDRSGDIRLRRGGEAAVVLVGGRVVKRPTVHAQLPEIGVRVARLVRRGWRRAGRACRWLQTQTCRMLARFRCCVGQEC